MPRLNIQILIDRLEEIDAQLSLIWEELQNYDLITALESQRVKLRSIIDSLEILVN